MKKVILKIDGMTCSACSSGLEKYLKKQDGVDDCIVNLVLQQATIEYEDNLSIDDLNKYIKNAGFISRGIYDPLKEEKNKNKTLELILNGLLVIIIMYISMAHMLKLPTMSFLDIKTNFNTYAMTLFIFSLYFITYGRDIIINGIKNIWHKIPNMDSLVSVGVLTSFFYSSYNMISIFLTSSNKTSNLYFESCCVIIYLIKLGRNIEGVSKNKTKEAIKDLVKITPSKALIKKNNKEVELNLDEVKKDDILIVKPGMKIAVDGIVIKGTSHVSEAFITGESVPVKKNKDDRVIAGSLNIDGVLEYQAKKIGKDSTISEIVRLVVEASNNKIHLARIADKVSGIFVPTIMIIALLTFVGYLFLGFSLDKALLSFVTVLLVACPCSLGLATPLAIVIAEGICAKKGILVKKSSILELATKIDTVIFDKTGTLTNGDLDISKINNYSRYSTSKLLEIVCSIENKSTHPISSAFNKYQKSHNIKLLDVKNFKVLNGLGLYAELEKNKIYLGNSKILTKQKIQNNYENEEKKLALNGNSIVYVIENSKIIGLIGVSDIIRNESKKTVSKLLKMNKNVIMLSGDNLNTVNLVAKKLGIKDVFAEMLPKDKTLYIKKSIENNHKVMMVGDGINDAPSLSSATIGVSFKNATDIAVSSADVILTSNDLYDIVILLEISKKTIKNIKQNLFWAFFYNILMIPAAIGLLKNIGIVLNPMLAGLAMTLSSLTVVLNALRLKKGYCYDKREKI